MARPRPAPRKTLHARRTVRPPTPGREAAAGAGVPSNPPMSEERSGRESERRFATVLFGDISGFTAMSEKLDPEEVTTIMNRCFDTLEAAVTSRGGHVDKYIGDCIMATFGVPIAVERAATLAVSA